MPDPQAPTDGDDSLPTGPESTPTPTPVPEASQTSEASEASQAAEVAELAAETVTDEDAEAEAGAEGAPSAPENPAQRPGLSPAACGARLAELFPALFGPDGPPKPIKLRIHVDLQARAPGVFSRRALGPFFARYTTSNAYLKVLSTATQRFDLDGQPAGEVTEEHRAAALTELARRREIAIARRAAERNAARPPRPPADGAGPSGEPRRPPREARPERSGADRRPEGHHRPDRPPRPERGGGGGSDRRPPRPGPRPPQGARRPEPPRVPPHASAAREPSAPAPEPQDPAQRERALLLRQFESSPLTKSNFCVLRRISESELDAQLAQARAERSQRR
jgi:sRNA-binding protein